LPDPVFLYLRNCMTFRKVTNPWRPRSFNDHILRLMIGPRDARRRVFGDKLATRDYIAARFGSGYLTDLYMEADDSEKIEFAALPNRFVLKANHGSGMNEIVFDKAKLDIERLKVTMRGWMATDYGKEHREWVYKNLRPRIFAEELLESAPGKVSYDYKMFCFHGRVRLIQVVLDRFSPTVHFPRTHAFYDPDWRRLNMSWGVPQGRDVAKPPVLAKMMEVACKVSAGLNFLRVDLYVLGDRIVIGELTNFPDAGNSRIEPMSRDYWLGSFFDARLESTC
jgi:TupA-like ATPgrasp